MPAMAIGIRVDAAKVAELFNRAPEATTRRLRRVVEDAAIDLQREIRLKSPVHDGAYRASVKYRLNVGRLEAEVGPTVNYAKWIEEGSRPHWVSVKEGTPLAKWAKDHGIDKYAVQASIAKKGTKEQRVVEKVYNFQHRIIERQMGDGLLQLVRELNDGSV